MKNEITKSFNRIALLEDNWDHNQNYEKLLLREINNKEGVALDIGCGTGEFAKRLSSKVTYVNGIDLSPVMIQEAQKRHAESNIDYAVQDFDEMDESKKYDYVVSIATFHHLDLESALPKIKRLLKENGKLIVLDLYERKGIVDGIRDIIAVPMNKVVRRIKCGNVKVSQEEIDAWNEHSQYDHYMTMKELKDTYKRLLGEGISLKALLFWRYILVYTKKS